jgi:hypothetical protein
MSKDRNTYAKRQREALRQQKAEQKRDRRAKKKQQADTVPDQISSAELTPQERQVLDLFQNYLMTPGEMLCLGRADIVAFEVPLAQLTSKGLLVAENYQGGYALTEAGFAAMQKGK